MSLPEELTYITVTGQVSDPLALAIFKTPVWLIGDPIVPRFGVAAVLDLEGAFSVQLPATDDPAWAPINWTYEVEIRSGGSVLAGSLAVPYDTVGSIDLSTALQPEQAAESGVIYLLASARGAAGGVASLDGSGDLPLTQLPAHDHAIAEVISLQAALDSKLNAVSAHGDVLTAGEAIMPRMQGMGGVGMENGNMHLSYFTATKTETINSVITGTVETAAVNNTLARIGIYSVNSEGGLIGLLASTANLTSLWASTYQNVTRALSAPFSKVAGTRYAVGLLRVGGTGAALTGLFPSASIGRLNPRINGIVFGTPDLPASVDAGSVFEDYRMLQAVLIP